MVVGAPLVAAASALASSPPSPSSLSSLSEPSALLPFELATLRFLASLRLIRSFLFLAVFAASFSSRSCRVRSI